MPILALSITAEQILLLEVQAVVEVAYQVLLQLALQVEDRPLSILKPHWSAMAKN